MKCKTLDAKMNPALMSKAWKRMNRPEKQYKQQTGAAIHYGLIARFKVGE